MPGRFQRILKHLWFDESDARRAIPPAMAQRLRQHVAASEQHHSGQIRICVEASLPLHTLWRNASMSHLTHARAIALFGELRVWDTEANNGVLIYLLLAEHAIELVADRGLNRHVSAHEWQALTQRMGDALREGRFEDGLTQALDEVSALLVQYFPLAPGQARHNELPDAPVVR
ncbi:MAG: TPM domain-containing protein [Rhodoferax sp.]|nr:TPM domain-containing protein [Rhodoferax sp.]